MPEDFDLGGLDLSSLTGPKKESKDRIWSHKGKTYKVLLKKFGEKNSRIVFADGTQLVVPTATLAPAGADHQSMEHHPTAPVQHEAPPQPRGKGELRKAIWNYQGRQIEVSVIRIGGDNTRIELADKRRLIVPNSDLTAK